MTRQASLQCSNWRGYYRWTCHA